jgi:hypothetical protein
MLKIFALCFLVIGAFPATAQSDDYYRCEIRRMENGDQFEHWLHSKQVNGATKLTTTYKIPVVVHIIHTGEPVGESYNYSMERIDSQIRTLE